MSLRECQHNLVALLCSFGAMGIALASLIGYMITIPSLYEWYPPQLAANTASALFLLSVASAINSARKLHLFF